jgi:putative intracellular protease/amidase
MPTERVAPNGALRLRLHGVRPSMHDVTPPTVDRVLCIVQRVDRCDRNPEPFDALTVIGGHSVVARDEHPSLGPVELSEALKQFRIL